MTSPVAFLFLTRACNLTCEHCYVTAAPGLEGHMALYHFNKILDLLAACKINDIRLTGGEPMVHPHFGEILTNLSARGIHPRLITNGIRLMNAPSPSTVLDTLDGCWISVYGLTVEQHRTVGGRATKSLDSILDFAGEHTKAGSWVGISALLSDVDEDALERFFESACRYGVRRLRFLFSEPSGRALKTGVLFAPEPSIHTKAQRILNEIRRLGANGNFDSVTLNNPFDLASTDKIQAYSSCMLHQRKMWSFSPEGGIYSCCFNIYKPAHLVGNVDDPEINVMLAGPPVGAVFGPRCEGLSPQFWAKNSTGTSTCPISIVPVENQIQSMFS